MVGWGAGSIGGSEWDHEYSYASADPISTPFSDRLACHLLFRRWRTRRDAAGEIATIRLSKVKGCTDLVGPCRDARRKPRTAVGASRPLPRVLGKVDIPVEACEG